MDKELIKDKVERHIRAQVNGLVWERIRDQDLIPDLLIYPHPNLIKNPNKVQVWWQVWNKFNETVYRPVYDQVWVQVEEKVRGTL